MAEFCKQCAGELGEPGDFEGSDPFELVLCEGCGPIQVNEWGECISPDCWKRHGQPEGGVG